MTSLSWSNILPVDAITSTRDLTCRPRLYFTGCIRTVVHESQHDILRTYGSIDYAKSEHRPGRPRSISECAAASSRAAYPITTPQHPTDPSAHDQAPKPSATTVVLPYYVRPHHWGVRISSREASSQETTPPEVAFFRPLRHREPSSTYKRVLDFRPHPSIPVLVCYSLF